MNIGVCPNSGAYPHANLSGILPTPGDHIQRQFRRLVCETGLSIDASIGAFDPRLQHCILLPAVGLLVTATRAYAPLLEASCADLARVTSLDVLLLRFVPQFNPAAARGEVNACLIEHDTGGGIIAREGYVLSVRSQGGILLRHALPEVPDRLVSHEGMITSVRARLD